MSAVTPWKINQYSLSSIQQREVLIALVLGKFMNSNTIRVITIVNETKITRKNKQIVNEYCERIFKFGYVLLNPPTEIVSTQYRTVINKPKS